MPDLTPNPNTLQMSTDITFDDVCKAIKEQGREDPTLIEAADNLLGLALVCSPVVLGPAAVLALPALAVKNELIKIGKSVFEKLTKKKTDDYLSRHESMRTAYGLIVFTSFFDALDAGLPKALRDALAKRDASSATGAVGRAVSTQSETATSEAYSVSFPYLTETLTDQRRRQATLWKRMGRSFVEFVRKQVFYDEAGEEERQALLSGLENIEEKAAERFEAQFFELAGRFEDFAVWANLHAHRETEALIRELSDDVKHHADRSAASETKIDVGFTELCKAILTIPETLRSQQAREIAESLKKHYDARIAYPIIEGKEIGDDEPHLSFPKVRDAFVPQSFRVLRQARRSRPLEDESTWSELPRRNDLSAFLLSYLSSPYSIEAPLLVLGHPGSGKSLLTTVLSARLMSKEFTAIRVPLRAVNADSDILTQIEEFIKQVSGVSDPWKNLKSYFENCPPLVILDGYDELLQASGQVFASYIMDAQRLQQQHHEQGWPLRIIITSRVMLINKANVPAGSTIVRLLEFSQQQREHWLSIWNNANAAYFKDVGIEKFALPAIGDEGAAEILSLAEQPLLLLMLALYDSQGNELRNSTGLDRTKLYDSLLRRFVVRERSKEKGFSDANPKDQEKILLLEMERLGVAALGMYNRRQVHILSGELDDDLKFFSRERGVTTQDGKPLGQADLLLGSFFFVHKSRARHRSGADVTQETFAFEFLHNTFGEFLVADFIIRRAVSQVEALRAAEKNSALKTVVDGMLSTADGFARDWFASLVYAALFTRPVIMEMMREWTRHVLQEYGDLSEEHFVEALERIILNQIERLLNKREMPQIMRKETAQEGYRVPFRGHPLVGHIAIYSINLVLLRLIAGKAAFVFEESDIPSHEDGTRPWDRLVHMWRSWFSLGNLNGLTAVMLAERSDNKVTVRLKARLQVDESRGKLQELYNVGLSVGDDVAVGIAGLCLFDPSTDSVEKLNMLEQRLDAEDVGVGLAISLSKLLVLAAGFGELAAGFGESAEEFESHAKKFVSHAGRTLEQAVRSGRIDQLESASQVIARTLERDVGGRVTLREVLSPGFVAEIAMRDPRSGRVLFHLGRQSGDAEWILEVSMRFVDYLTDRMRVRMDELGSRDWFVDTLQLIREVGGARGLAGYVDSRVRARFVESAFHPRPFWRIVERNPEAAVAYLQVLREVGGRQHFEDVVARRMGPDGIERSFGRTRVAELIERNPEGALAYVQVVRVVGGPGLVRELVTREIGRKVLRGMFCRQRFLGVVERNPEGAIAYVQVLRELAGRQQFERLVKEEIGEKALKRLVQRRDLWARSSQGMSWLSVWLVCARILESTYVNRVLVKALTERSDRHGDLKGRLSLLPIWSLDDLRWLSEQTGDTQLSASVGQLGS